MGNEFNVSCLQVEHSPRCGPVPPLREVLTVFEPSRYLKVIDKYNEWLVSAYVSASGVKFMLLHDTPNVDGIRNFFIECHELFVKVCVFTIMLVYV